jgi:predicted TIM-barrel fold metal-dependent hydrolase
MKILPFIALTLLAGTSSAADDADPRLVAEIARIRAIDNHSHDDPVDPQRGGSWQPDNPLGAADYPDVVPLRRDNAEWLQAWRALYGYQHPDMEPGHLRELLSTKQRLMREGGERWPTIVLDKAGVDIALVNATQLGVGQRNDRFRWVPYADPLLWPFAGDKSRLFYSGGPSSIAQLQRELSVAKLPATLDEYVAQIVEPTLARWQKSGAVAVKFLAAYARSLDFQPVAAEAAAAVYSRAAAGAALDPAQTKALEDYLFYEICARAGAHQIVIHIHTGNGNGPYFNNTRADPLLLETALDSKALRNTRFVLLHGGWPFALHAQAMMDKPNTYADFSAQTFYLPTHALAEVMRGWLGWHPEKVLFGSDAYSDANTPLSDYEEKEVLMTLKSRRALAIALTAMVRDEEITEARAIEIARMVMRDNAVGLYRLDVRP